MALWGKKSKADDKGASQNAGATQTPRVEIPVVEPAQVVTRTGTAGASSQATASLTKEPSQTQQKIDQSLKPASEAAQKTAAESKRLLMAFGGIVSVLMKTPQFKGMTVGQLETLVVPAILAGQYVVAEAQSQETGLISPVGMALWAVVSPEVDKRLAQDLDQPMPIAPNEWRSGEIAWLILTAGDTRVINPMLRNVQQTLLKGAPMKVRARGKSGKMEVGIVQEV